MGRTPAVAVPVSRDKPLRDFLGEVHAHQMWGQRVDGVGMLECYVSGGRLFIVQLFQSTPCEPISGWDVFVPADTSGKIDSTLDAVRAYLKGGV